MVLAFKKNNNKRTKQPAKKSEKTRKNYRKQNITAIIRHNLNIINEIMMKQQVECKSQNLNIVHKIYTIRYYGI